jgi:periplasmic protein TonB
MKHIIIMVVFFSAAFSSYGQSNIPAPPLLENKTGDTSKIFTQVEFEAQFPGGDNGWRGYLIKNFDVEKVTKKMPRKKKSYSETAIVKFIVKKDGTLSDIEVENNVPNALKKEAIRLIKESPNWIPAIQNGRKVNAYRRQPLTIEISVE